MGHNDVNSGLEDSIHTANDAMKTTLAALPEKEQARRLTEFSHRWGNESTSRFFALNDFLTVKFLDGNIKKRKFRAVQGNKIVILRMLVGKPLQK